jgi:hypothetical protein
MRTVPHKKIFNESEMREAHFNVEFAILHASLAL